MPTIAYRTASLQTAQAVNEPTFTCPLKGVKDKLILTQTWEQVVTSTTPWAPLALNTPHSQYSDFILAEESPLTARGGYAVSWTRTYAKIPDSYTEPGGTYSYEFPGFNGVFGINTTTVTGRDPFTEQVQVHVIKDFFLVDPTTGSAGGTGTLASPYDLWESIPVIPKYQFYYDSLPYKVKYLDDSPPMVTATTPSRAAYITLVGAGTLIAVEMSKLTRWNGLIYMRETMKVTPQ